MQSPASPSSGPRRELCVVPRRVGQGREAVSPPETGKGHALLFRVIISATGHVLHPIAKGRDAPLTHFSPVSPAVIPVPMRASNKRMTFSLRSPLIGSSVRRPSRTAKTALLQGPRIQRSKQEKLSINAPEENEGPPHGDVPSPQVKGPTFAGLQCHLEGEVRGKRKDMAKSTDNRGVEWTVSLDCVHFWAISQ